MFESKIHKLFESKEISQYLTLRRVELDDATFTKLLGLKPGEINLIISRTTSIIKNDGGEKSRGQLLNDILEVLERSAVARSFCGIGLNQEYRLFKGFPVRKGDAYESMPEIGHELVLQPEKAVIGWGTDATAEREIGAKYDSSKGEPIGGLLCETHVDASKIVFDVNAVSRVCKAKMDLINQYNTQCAPGKSISKVNVAFLSSQAPVYHGEYEVLTTNAVVNTRVTDKWSWDDSNGQKVVKWVGSEPTAPDQAQPKQGETAQQEHLAEMFNQVPVKETCEGCSLNIDAYHMDEGFMDKMRGIGNWINKTAAITVRGKTMKYLELLLKQYSFQKQIYELAAQYSQKIDQDSSREEYANDQISKIEELIMDVQNALRNIQENPKDGLTLVKPEEAQLAEELHGVFNESTLGIFDRVADAVVNVKDRVTHKQLDVIFKKLIRAMENHYHYRMKALEMQRDLLTTDYNSYKGTRFEQLKPVQALKTMIEYTVENMRLVQAMKSEFEKDKMEAANFTFTGNSAPKSDEPVEPKSDAEKTHVVALDKKEDELDAKTDQLVKAAGVAATTAPTEMKPEVPSEPTADVPQDTAPAEVPAASTTPNPTDDEVKDVSDTIDAIDKGFGAAAAKPTGPVIPKNFTPEMKANVDKQMRIRKSVWFKKDTTAKAFAKVNPGWTVDNPAANVFRVKPPEPGSAPVQQEPVAAEPVVNAKPIKPARPTVSKPKVVKPTTVEEPPISSAPNNAAPAVEPEPVAQEPVAPAATPEVPSQSTPTPAEEPVAQEPAPVAPEVAPEPPKAEEPPLPPVATPAPTEPVAAQEPAATPKVKKPRGVKPAKAPKTPEVPPTGATPAAAQVTPAAPQAIKPAKPQTKVVSKDDINNMSPPQQMAFVDYMNALEDIRKNKENADNLQKNIRPNSDQILKDYLTQAQQAYKNAQIRLDIFKREHPINIADADVPAAMKAYQEWQASPDKKVYKGSKPERSEPYGWQKDKKNKKLG